MLQPGKQKPNDITESDPGTWGWGRMGQKGVGSHLLPAIFYLVYVLHKQPFHSPQHLFPSKVLPVPHRPPGGPRLVCKLCSQWISVCPSQQPLLSGGLSQDTQWRPDTRMRFFLLHIFTTTVASLSLSGKGSSHLREALHFCTPGPLLSNKFSSNTSTAALPSCSRTRRCVA